MDLHTARIPEWKNIPHSERNRWQKWAAATNGWIAPGNGVTLGGNGLFFGGLAEMAVGNVGLGLCLAAAGRGLDVVDGAVAHATGTKSPLGEALDAGFDKLQALAAGIVCVEADIVPLPIVGIVVAQQAAMAGASAYTKMRGREIHPSFEGKIGTAAAWATLASGAIAQITTGVGSRFAESMSYGGAAATATLGAVAAWGYLQDGRRPAPEADPAATENA